MSAPKGREEGESRLFTPSKDRSITEEPLATFSTKQGEESHCDVGPRPLLCVHSILKSLAYLLTNFVSTSSHERESEGAR